MEDEGIEDGDLLVIRQDPSPEIGELVIALDEENQNTLKKYGGKDKKTGKAILRYCNQAFYGGNDDEKAGYFCIENNEHERKCGPFLCRWLPGGIHLNYGPAHRTQE